MTRKKIKVVFASMIICTFAACYKTNENNQEEKMNTMTAISDATDGENLTTNELEKLLGEYEYLSDYGTGKLIIKKTDHSYDISDYESENSYRFLADFSNIEAIEGNRILIKYPEQVFSDDTVVFCYYILEYSTEGIDVYYRKSEQEENQFLYHATMKM